jgi:hypothetical protein
MMPPESSVSDATIWRVTLQLSIIILEVSFEDRNMFKELTNEPNKLECFFPVASFFFLTPLIFASKAKHIVFCFPRKYLSKLENLARDKHSRLLCFLVTAKGTA